LGFGLFMLGWGLLLGGLDKHPPARAHFRRARISALAVFIGRAGRDTGLRTIGLFVGPVVLSLALALIEFAEESRPQRS